MKPSRFQLQFSDMLIGGSIVAAILWVGLGVSIGHEAEAARLAAIAALPASLGVWLRLGRLKAETNEVTG
ncbi:hypothetical protein MU852_03295 [Brevundimonas albigilva]|uniref:hypothetical protein n=1 Tax=Brevundimonas albigilva TaxID=1312364 RepID=UPI00201B60A4|nr:hypothetical protein [Brevundimonas albigilva]UQV18917.1 hypothetical protein MU852_03295 [Brevundimonas albigilva]